MIDEEDELLNELTTSWQQNYKKSLVTVLILKSLEVKPLWSKGILDRIEDLSETKVSLDEKSLYRALRRLEKTGLISHESEQVKKTGAKRKIYEVSEFGVKFLQSINELLVELPK